MDYEQKERPISILTPLGPDVLLLQGFTGTEGISRLFRFDLELLSERSSVDFNDIIGKNVTITIRLSDGSDRFINGFISRFVQGSQDYHFTHYQAEMVPWAWFLTRNANCRIFQNMEVPDIVTTILGKCPSAHYRKTLQKSYPEREYCVQYRETDYNFVARLMEQCGIFYFFEHDKDKHTLVIADDMTVHQACPRQATAHYELSTGGTEHEDLITSWSIGQQIRSAKYSLNDYNFEYPHTSLLVGEPTVVHLDANSGSEIYDYPGEYEKVSEGEGLARVRIQEEETPGMVAVGSSTCRAFATGFRFDLAEFYRSDMNGSYVLTELEHTASMGGGNYVAGRDDSPAYYSNRFVCIPATIQFRPSRATPRPVVMGSQTALVVGKSGEEIWVDKYGRVKVQFYWDRQGKKDENSSCWIRVSQPWAGKQWGGVWIPRVGQEVVVSFMEGDPDQPLITGRVYNADQMPPYELPANQTQSGFKSRSSKNGSKDNFNEIRFEDKKGQEDLLIHAELTMHNSVEASQFITVGGDRHITTGGEKDGAKSGDVKELTYGSHNLHVKSDDRIKIEGTSDVHVLKDASESYDSDLVQSVGGKCVILADTIQLQGTTKIVLMAGASSVVIDASGVTVLGTPLINLNSPGAPPAPEIPPLIVDPDDP